MLVCKVVIKRLPFALDYLALPQTNADDYQFGTLAEVPYRGDKTVGIIIATTTTLSVPKDKVKTILALGEKSLPLCGQVKFFEHFINYYATSMAEFLQMIIPRELWSLQIPDQGQWCHAKIDKIVTRSTLTKAGWKLHEWLVSNGPARVSTIISLGFRSATIKQCREKDMLVYAKIHSGSEKKQADVNLSLAQKNIYNDITQSSKSVHYVHGVTGSGKTYLYMACARRWIHLGYQVLMLVPEIGLTPQLREKLLGYFPADRVAILHSGLSDLQRAHVWREASTGAIQLLIGTRSALFTPLPKLGLIIVDEEHDLSYKQISQIRYSARGVAFLRARTQKATLILGSATPSLSCLKLINEHHITRHKLETRFFKADPPLVKIIAITDKKLRVGFSNAALSTIRSTLDSNKRVLVFLNRRGYSPCVWCPTCDLTKACHGCDKPMTYHQSSQSLACHRCNVTHQMSKTCQKCGQDSCIPLGQGTEKVALFLQDAFPETSVIKMDKDSCQTWTQLEATLSSIHSSGNKIIVATQMMVKGHHIEDLDTVIVLGCDQSLRSKDYKAQELLLSQMGQVIGRSGRGHNRGVVIIQTAYPDHMIWEYIKNHQYDDAAEYLMQQRSSYGLPPYSTQAALHFASTSPDACIKEANSIQRFLERNFSEIATFGPMPSITAKLKGQHRHVLIIQSTDSSRVQLAVTALSSLIANRGKNTNIIIERDPVEV